MNFILTEDKRQAIILAIAHLADERPGWNNYLSEIAKDLGDKDLIMYKKFQETIDLTAELYGEEL